MMSNIARRGFNYKQPLARATHVIEIRQNRVIDGVKMMSAAPQQRYDLLEKTTELLKSGQESVIKASLEYLQVKAKITGELALAFNRSTIATSTLLGVPWGHSSSFVEGPAIFLHPRIRKAIWHGSTDSITDKGKNLNDPHVIADVGDVPVQDIRDFGVKDDRLTKLIRDSVKIVMDQPTLRPLVLGCDQSVSLSVVRTIYEQLAGPVDVLHFGAHLDHENPLVQSKEKGYVNRLVQVGLRSITPEGRKEAKKNNAEIHEMKDFEKERHDLEKLKLGVGEGVKGVYVSIDVDCLDHDYAREVSLHESRALSLQDVLNILQNLEGDIVGGDVVEYNPQHDDTNYKTTARVTAKLIKELAAKMSK
ncbi:putative arginase [Medicago truncatula]|uniref:Arginase family protein n=1 Tax=Medicago truncatula TaxID=3880 RepID=A0A072TGY3_MEDTR|nr:arginase, mitochondrial-like isoform X1 [Medicago truncatula]XP_024630333.1 arginase, mitochondrial-like isoform X1 [Medicago truncatula]KEH16819.1 arginase family protein [Medicago truncatula]RHN51476.1 putative arginase [Medicago truncatula]